MKNKKISHFFFSQEKKNECFGGCAPNVAGEGV
jgi:hypothetical protein